MVMETVKEMEARIGKPIVMRPITYYPLFGSLRREQMVQRLLDEYVGVFLTKKNLPYTVAFSSVFIAFAFLQTTI